MKYGSMKNSWPKKIDWVGDEKSIFDVVKSQEYHDCNFFNVSNNDGKNVRTLFISSFGLYCLLIRTSWKGNQEGYSVSKNAWTISKT